MKNSSWIFTTLSTIKSSRSQRIEVKEYQFFWYPNERIIKKSAWMEKWNRGNCLLIKNIYIVSQREFLTQHPYIYIYFSAKITYLQNRGHVQSPDSIKAGRANFNFLKYNCPRYIGDPSISICDAEGFWLKRKPISGTWSSVTFYRGLLRYDFRENIGHLEVDIFLPYYGSIEMDCFCRIFVEFHHSKIQFPFVFISLFFFSCFLNFYL